MTKDKTVL